MTAARRTIDSLLSVTPADSPDLPDLIFARATFAASALDANLDYEKIIAEFSSSPRREESLLRLAQRALIGGDGPRALEHLRILSRDYPDHSSQATSGYWMSRVLLESNQVTAACEANRGALAHAKAKPSALLREIEAQGVTACSRPAAIALPDSQQRAVERSVTPRPPRGAGPSRSKQYAVQVSAFATRSDAEQMSAGLRRSGLDAHVDGNVRPFRVRIGHYASYAEAAKALRDLKPRKLAGFVTVLDP